MFDFSEGVNKFANSKHKMQYFSFTQVSTYRSKMEVCSSSVSFLEPLHLETNRKVFDGSITSDNHLVNQVVKPSVSLTRV